MGGGSGGMSTAGTSAPMCNVDGTDNLDCPAIPPFKGECSGRGVCCHRSSNAAKEKALGPNDPLVPFDLWHLQARTYLAHLGVAQPRLLELFQQTLADGVTRSPTDLQIDCAWLALTVTERAILTNSLPGKQPWDFWGLLQNANSIPNPNKPADPTTRTTHTSVRNRNPNDQPRYTPRSQTAATR